MGGSNNNNNNKKKSNKGKNNSKMNNQQTTNNNKNTNNKDSATKSTIEEVPMQVSQSEYDDLLQQASELSLQEAQEEWLECARYGEVDAIRALLKHHPTLVQHQDSSSGNTALHMGAANGHLLVAKFLLQNGHGATIKNQAGNTPLHWAASNGQAEIVELLTKQANVDVLEQNEFGRSALTEGFTSQKEQVVKSLLEHESASEEKLLSAKNGKETSITHELFGVTNNDNKQPLKIRELAIANADNPFADTDRPDQDTTGYSIWSASIVLAQWMIDIQKWDETTIALELGAGCAVPGLAMAKASSIHPKHVYLTDLNPVAVDNIQYNIQLNSVTDRATALRMDWQDKSTWPKEPCLDVVIGSDLIYQSSLVPLLTSVVMDLLKPGGVFYYVAPDTGRDGLQNFITAMKEQCPDWKEQLAPAEYITNPLTNQDDEECFLHFQELSSLTFILYEFPKSS